MGLKWRLMGLVGLKCLNGPRVMPNGSSVSKVVPNVLKVPKWPWGLRCLIGLGCLNGPRVLKWA